MAIIAYQQPVTRPQIDAIRGVNSDGVMKTLLSKGLIQEVGRTAGPGRPILYSTTPEFLGYFGLTSTDKLPPLNLKDFINEDEPENGKNIEGLRILGTRSHSDFTRTRPYRPKLHLSGVTTTVATRNYLGFCIT